MVMILWHNFLCPQLANLIDSVLRYKKTPYKFEQRLDVSRLNQMICVILWIECLLVCTCVYVYCIALNRGLFI